MEGTIKRIFFLVLLSYVGTAFAQQDSDISLDRLLTQEQQRAIGVQKLTKEERARLRTQMLKMYVSGYEAGKKEGIEQAGRSTASQQSTSVIESQIDGKFEGWEDETVIKLMNGQIWQQTGYYHRYHYSFNSEVLIYQSGSGYKMKVDGVDRAVGVRRLK